MALRFFFGTANVKHPATAPSVNLQAQLRWLQAVKLQVRVLVHHVTRSLQTGQRVERFAYTLWFYLQIGVAHHMPVGVSLFQSKRPFRIVIFQTLDLRS